MDEAKVTVLMPLKYYHPAYLKKAFNSVINQTSSNWYLLIIVEREDLYRFKHVLAEELNDSRINVIASEGKKLSGQYNTGMRCAKTDFVTVLHADDVLADDTIEVLNKYIIEYPLVDFFHSSRRYINEDDKLISSVYFSKETVNVEDFKKGSPVKHLLCWRKEKALKIGGMDESLGNTAGPDDWDFPWMMAENGTRFKAMKECLYFYRDHRHYYRLTTHQTLVAQIRGVIKIMRKHKVGYLIVWKTVLRAQMGYLRQCMYITPLDKWIKQKLNFGLHASRRESYS